MKLHGLWVMTPRGVGVIETPTYAPGKVRVHLVNDDGTTRMSVNPNSRSGFEADAVIVDIPDLVPATFAQIPRLRAPSAEAARDLGITVTAQELADEVTLRGLEPQP